MITLQSPFLQFNCMPEHASWSLINLSGMTAWVENARMSVSYRSGRRYESLADQWRAARIAGPESTPSPHGPLQQARVFLGPDRQGLHCEIRFALAEEHPLLLWQMTLSNQGILPLYLSRVDLLRAGITGELTAQPSTICLHPDAGQMAFFSNGWQSWSFSGAYGAGEAPHSTRLGPIQAPMQVNHGTPLTHIAGHFSSDFFGVLGDRTHRTGLLAGFLSQLHQFGSLEAWTSRSPGLRLWANCDDVRISPGQQVHTDWAALTFIDLNDPDCLAGYLDAVARQNDIRVKPAIPHGWCSWYQFYQKVTAEDVRRNTHTLAELKPHLPLDLVQIDDGFEAQVGDWFEFRETFPDGVAPLAREIKEAGFTPGLWLAPFIVHPHARLNKTHPEFILRNGVGRPVNAGFVWNTFTRAIDLSHPGALEYACRVVETAAHEWGFPYLKLDFLYAGALPGHRHDPGRSRAQILRAGLEALRQAAGEDSTLVGCGVPLGSALGLFETLRIGPDVNGEWEPSYYGLRAPLRYERSIPSASNAIRNILTRAPMHLRWWINDPDCMLVRPDTHLTLAEVQSLATVIALSGGSLLFSDDIPSLPAERLRLAQTLLPAIGARPQVLDWFDSSIPRRVRLVLDGPAGEWHLLAMFNWNDHPEDLSCSFPDFGLPPRPLYLARSFWSQETWLVQDSTLILPGVPAHGVVLIAVRPFQTSQAQFLGSDLHISQGIEVAGWHEDENGLQLTLDLPRRAEGMIDLRLPAPPAFADLDGAALTWEALGEGQYRFKVAFEHKADLRISYARKGAPSQD